MVGFPVGVLRFNLSFPHDQGGEDLLGSWPFSTESERALQWLQQVLTFSSLLGPSQTSTCPSGFCFYFPAHKVEAMIFTKSPKRDVATPVSGTRKHLPFNEELNSDLSYCCLTGSLIKDLKQSCSGGWVKVVKGHVLQSEMSKF